MEPTIRPAGIRDASSIQHILRLAHQDNRAAGFFFPICGMSLRQLAYRIKRDRYYMLIQDGRAVGTIAVKKRKSHMEVGSLSILPDYWKKGWGRKMLDYAENQIRSLGHKRVVLYTPAAHPTLPDYYRHAGYRECRTVSMYRIVWKQFEKLL